MSPEVRESVEQDRRELRCVPSEPLAGHTADAAVVGAEGKRLLTDTLWMMGGFGARILAQALFFVIVARSLGASGYGVFMGAAALSAVVAPFAGLGAGNLLIQHVARENSKFSSKWGDAIIVTLSTGVVLVGALLVAGAMFLGGRIPLQLVLTVGIADLIFGRLLDTSSQAFQALGRMKRTAQLQVLPTVGKVVAALGLIVTTRQPTADDWARFYLGASVITTILALWLVRREAGVATFSPRHAFREIREGWHFAIGLSAQNIYNDVDKTMLASMSSAASVGIYAAAYRLIDVSFAPVRSLLYASYTTFFRAGTDGLRGTVSHARRLLPFALGYGALVSAMLLIFAPLVPRVLGRDYQAAVVAIRWLALLPMLKATHYLAADSLTGAGYQPLRSGIQIVIAIANVLANLVMIPRYSWLGAAWTSLACDALLAITLWSAALSHLARGSRAPVTTDLAI